MPESQHAVPQPTCLKDALRTQPRDQSFGKHRHNLFISILIPPYANVLDTFFSISNILISPVYYSCMQCLSEAWHVYPNTAYTQPHKFNVFTWETNFRIRQQKFRQWP